MIVEPIVNRVSAAHAEDANTHAAIMPIHHFFIEKLSLVGVVASAVKQTIALRECEFCCKTRAKADQETGSAKPVLKRQEHAGNAGLFCRPRHTVTFCHIQQNIL